MFAVASLYLVPLVVWDLQHWKRLHPVTLWGGLLVVLSGPARFALGRTDAWLASPTGRSGWCADRARGRSAAAGARRAVALSP